MSWTDEANKLMQVLDPREREIIKMRFFNQKKSTLAEIGRKYGITRERVRQIQNIAASKLRHEMVRTGKLEEIRVALDQ